MSKIASYANPNVTIPAFETISKELKEMYGAPEFPFLPKVDPGGLEQELFEDFACDFFYNVREPPFPNGTGIAGQPDPNNKPHFVKDLTKPLVRSGCKDKELF